MHRFRLLVVPLASTLAALAFVLVAAAPAGAATTEGRAAYTPRSAVGARPATTPVSPSGCYQRADNPHYSKHSHDILAKVWTKCPVRPVISIFQSVQEWETRWWGWDRAGTPGHKTVFATEYGATFAHLSCRHSTIRSTGSGSIADVDGGTYYAGTESNYVTNPCG